MITAAKTESRSAKNAKTQKEADESLKKACKKQSKSDLYRH